MIFTFFPWQIPHLGQEEFVFHLLILFHSQAMLPSFEIGYWKKSFSKQKKRSRIFFKKMSRGGYPPPLTNKNDAWGGDITPLPHIRGGYHPPTSHKGVDIAPGGDFPPPTPLPSPTHFTFFMAKAIVTITITITNIHFRHHHKKGDCFHFP